MNFTCWLFDHDWHYRTIKPAGPSDPPIYFKGIELIWDAVKELYCARCRCVEGDMPPMQPLPRFLPFRYRRYLWGVPRAWRAWRQS